jgi:methylenetetrahydrofolate reductase (NADPH)
MFHDILDGFSLEMTGKDVPSLDAARTLLPAGTRVNVTYLGNENFQMRRTAIRAVASGGFTPVPHISARRLPSQRALEEFLAALREDGTARDVFAVGGDPARPQGPYSSSLDVIRSGLLEKYGAGSVSISGYPEGHPEITDDLLWSAITDKSREVARRGMVGDVITQFSFDADAVVAWIGQVSLPGNHPPCPRRSSRTGRGQAPADLRGKVRRRIERGHSQEVRAVPDEPPEPGRPRPLHPATV